jgi:predicted membrane chloride channel (bestrophin family)
VQPGADRTLLPEPLTLARSLMLRRLAYFGCALSRLQLAELDSADCVSTLYDPASRNSRYD